MLSHDNLSELDRALLWHDDGYEFGEFWTAMWRHAEHGNRWWPEEMQYRYPEEVDVYVGMPMDSIVALVKMGRPTNKDEMPSLNYALLCAALYLKLEQTDFATLRRIIDRLNEGKK